MAQARLHQKLIKEGESALKDPDVKPEEVEEWWRNKGMDKSEAREAIDKWKHSKGAEEWDRMQKAAAEKKGAQAAPKQAAKSPKKWGFWFIVFIAVLILIGFILNKMGLIRL